MLKLADSFQSVLSSTWSFTCKCLRDMFFKSAVLWDYYNELAYSDQSLAIGVLGLIWLDVWVSGSSWASDTMTTHSSFHKKESLTFILLSHCISLSSSDLSVNQDKRLTDMIRSAQNMNSFLFVLLGMILSGYVIVFWSIQVYYFVLCLNLLFCHCFCEVVNCVSQRTLVCCMRCKTCKDKAILYISVPQCS